SGPGCCERAPDADPSGQAAATLNDAANAAYDPDHQADCETAEMDGGKMDRYATGASCSDPRNVAYADAATVQPYWDLAAGGALADQWFQPVIGASSSNDMFLFDAAFVFEDNDAAPPADGAECSFVMGAAPISDDSATIGRALESQGVSWTWYADGYAAMRNAEAMSSCPDAPADCPAGLKIYPCIYDPSDIPSNYYPAFADNAQHLRDYSSFLADLKNDQLAQVAFVKAIGYRSEHPGYGTTISDGAKFVDGVVKAVQQSAYAPDTLVLVVYDEGGGYFDHVAPPPAIDAHPYGTRVPVIAVGPWAKKGAISHVPMEHSSIVKFIESNWLGGATLMGARDATVSNIGSLLDPAAGVPQ
ncbi:MAG TPA: alkaline phosphatase family protein, partial [Polyangia bacterium]